MSSEFSMDNVEMSRLRSFDLFSCLNNQDLGVVAMNCRELRVPAGSTLIRQGQVGEDVFLLEQGTVQVYRGQIETPRVIAVLEAPVVIGEMALLDPERIRTSSVAALSDLRLLSISIDAFLLFLRGFPHLKESLLHLVDSRR